MGLGGEQGPIENKGKRSTGTSAPIQPEGYPWKRATESELGLPEVIVVTKVRYPSGKEYVRENTTNLSEKTNNRAEVDRLDLYHESCLKMRVNGRRFPNQPMIFEFLLHKSLEE